MRTNSILHKAGVSALILFSVLLFSSCGGRKSGPERASHSTSRNPEREVATSHAPKALSSPASQAWKSYGDACVAVKLFENQVISKDFKDSIPIAAKGKAAKRDFFSQIRELPVYSRIKEEIEKTLNRIEDSFSEAEKNSPDPNSEGYFLKPDLQQSIQDDCEALKSTIQSLCEKEVIKDASMNPTETGGLNSWLVIISWIILLAIIFFLARQISALRRLQSDQKRQRNSLNRKKEDELADLNRQLEQIRRQHEQDRESLARKSKELEEAQAKLSALEQQPSAPKSEQRVKEDKPQGPAEQRAFFGMPKGSGNGFFNDLFDHEDMDAKFKVVFRGSTKDSDGEFEPISFDRVKYNEVDRAVFFRGNREHATRMTVVTRGKVRFNPDYDYDRWDIVDPCVVEVN